ncbi:MAG TPA: DinB family protein [Terriglobales bacterium]|nr:DinB family protein [Terriglobales bacterium]
MPRDELRHFTDLWDQEARKTVELLESLPTDQYDFRPWKDGRSLGELAWHLCEVEAYPTYGIQVGSLAVDQKPPGITRPREVEALAPGYARVHGDALIRVRRLKPEDLGRELAWFDGTPTRVGEVLWSGVLLHLMHHRGQLVTLARLAGGKPPGLFGPTREQTIAMQERMANQ